MSDDDRPFRWEDLDQPLLSPKLEELAGEMQNRAKEAERKAAVETRESGNSAGYLPRLFEAQRQIVDEWAKKLYDVHCEVWRIQGHSISADFIRAVSKKPIRELIAVRKGSVEFGVKLWCTRIRATQDAVALRHWTRMMQQLAAKWTRKLEAEAVASAYGALTESAESPSQSGHEPDSPWEGRTPKLSKTAIGRNIDRLRKDCGWSFNDLADKTGLDKKLILGHVNGGKGIQPRTLKIYAVAFTRELKREVLVAELES